MQELIVEMNNTSLFLYNPFLFGSSSCFLRFFGLVTVIKEYENVWAQWYECKENNHLAPKWSIWEIMRNRIVRLFPAGQKNMDTVSLRCNFLLQQTVYLWETGIKVFNLWPKKKFLDFFQTHIHVENKLWILLGKLSFRAQKGACVCLCVCVAAVSLLDL